MSTVEIQGLRLLARHGVLDFEQKEEQPFVLSCSLDVDFFAAAKQDDVAKTVNYAEVCDLLQEVVQKNSFRLIERLAYACAYAVLERFPQVQAISLRVDKPQAPVSQQVESLAVTVRLQWETVYLSIGSSQGDKKAYLDYAVERLKGTRGVRVQAVSSYHRTQPYGGVAQNEFLNGAMRIRTVLTPRQLLDEIHAIEAEAKRTREVRWGDRTLDIDILFYGDRQIREPDLVVPHADYRNRAFVKQPLKEVAPPVLPDGFVL